MLDVWESLARLLRRSGRYHGGDRGPWSAPIGSLRGPPDPDGAGRTQSRSPRFDKARSLVDAAQTARLRRCRGRARLDRARRRRSRGGARHAEAARQGSPESAFRCFWLPGRMRVRETGTLRSPPSTKLSCSRRRSPTSPIEGLRAARADALAHLGRETDAEADFRIEVRVFPENLDAWSRLALLYASGGRTAEFQALVAEMTQRVPTRRCFEVAERVCEIAGDRKTAEDLRRRRPGPPAPSDPLRSRSP